MVSDEALNWMERYVSAEVLHEYGDDLGLPDAPSAIGRWRLARLALSADAFASAMNEMIDHVRKRQRHNRQIRAVSRPAPQISLSFLS